MAVERTPIRIVAQEPEVIQPGHAIRYPSTPDTRFPQVPRVERRPGGFLGLGRDRQADAHARRLLELYHLGVEVAYAEEVADAAEVRGVRTASDAVAKAEEIVYAHAPDSVGGMVAADITGEMAAGSRVRHRRLMDAYDAEALNIIRRS